MLKEDTMFIIYDWAGNSKEYAFGQFKTFDDAWDAIYDFIYHQLADEGYIDDTSEYDTEFDLRVSEYYVTKAK